MARHTSWGPEELFDRSMRGLDRARRGVDAGAVEAAIGVLSGASDVLFVGVGVSGVVAQDAVGKAGLFGVPCRAPVDVHQQLVAAAVCGGRSVMVAISRSGRTVETLRVACVAKDAGARVVALVGGPGPLAEVADVAVVVPSVDEVDEVDEVAEVEEVDVWAPVTSRLAALVVLDVLATGVMLRRPRSNESGVRQV